MEFLLLLKIELFKLITFQKSISVYFESLCGIFFVMQFIQEKTLAFV
jgi:hypothetical protein